MGPSPSGEIGLFVFEAGPEFQAESVRMAAPVVMIPRGRPSYRLQHKEFVAALLLETVSGYLSNTVSFVRVGAFALAHAALCVAIFAIERMVRSAPGGPIYGVAEAPAP